MADNNNAADAAGETPEEITLMLEAKAGDKYEVKKSVVGCVKFVTGMLEDCEEQNNMNIPVKEVEGPILQKVIDYCKYYHKQETTHMTADEADKWEKEFVDVDKAKLFALIRAANFLDIQSLLDLTCKTVADMIKGKTAEQVNSEFAIPEGTHLY